MLTLRSVVIVIAFVLFGIAAYVSPTLPERLTRLGLALVVLAWLLP